MAAKKKPSAGKTKAGKKVTNSADALAKELKGLIPRLDPEGLQFLIEQAQIHLYNMQVDELNQTMIRSQTTRAAAGSKSKPVKIQGGLRIEGTPSGSSYYLYYNGQSVMFTKEEIIRMVKIASAPVTKIEMQENLLNWFMKERRDIFATIPITDKFDEQLNKIALLLKKNFQVRK